MFVGLRTWRCYRSMSVWVLIIFVSVILTFTDLYQFTSRRYFVNGSGSSNYNYSSQKASSFSYQVAVAYQAKDRNDPIYANIKMDSLTGEDNYFIGIKTPSDIYAGVADGVGGWADHGFDSSAISRELCKGMSLYSTQSKIFTPKQLIDLAYTKIKNEDKVKVGGTTAIVAHFPPDGKLQIANLGDSWCGVFRNNRLVFQTNFQTVGFNAPYQLSIIPESMLKVAAMKGGSYIQNHPNDADEYNFQLKKNDIVILATDGVTDNIAIEDIELFLKDREKVHQDLDSTSQDFVSEVVKLSKDPLFPSVFAQEISKIEGKRYTGGKEDDITVVMVKVE